MLFREGFRWTFWIWKRDAISVSEKYNESTLQGYRILKSGKGSGTEKGLEEWIQQRHHEINHHWIQFVLILGKLAYKIWGRKATFFKDGKISNLQSYIFPIKFHFQDVVMGPNTTNFALDSKFQFADGEFLKESPRTTKYHI